MSCLFKVLAFFFYYLHLSNRSVKILTCFGHKLVVRYLWYQTCPKYEKAFSFFCLVIGDEDKIWMKLIISFMVSSLFVKSLS